MLQLKIAFGLAVAILGLPAPATAAIFHTVVPGESLSSIAVADGLSVEQLAAANGLPPTAELFAGSQLAIPPQITYEATQATPVVGSEDGDYDADDVTAGPSGEESAPTTSTSAATSQPVGAAAQGAPGAPPYPTAETVSPAQIDEIAAANGVSPSLASAIAYQESGFNNGFVSSADAVGVMQITPGTWSWVNETQAASSPLAPASALENVRGGVILLHSLLQATGGNEAEAVAGYYQGLPSVLQNGLDISTQQYVEDVQALQQRFGGG